MALLIEKPVATSAQLRVAYWRVAEYLVQPGAKVFVTMAGYWTEDDRRAGVQPADRRQIVLEGPPSDVAINWIYARVKLHAEFDGAADA